MSDLELPIRGRTYREPDGPHSVVVRGRDIESALQHVASRPDCTTLAIVGLPDVIPDLSALKGRRLLLVDADSGRLHDFAEAAIKVGAEVEWIRSARPSSERLAASLLPVGAVVLAAGLELANERLAEAVARVRRAADGAARDRVGVRGRLPPGGRCLRGRRGQGGGRRRRRAGAQPRRDEGHVDLAAGRAARPAQRDGGGAGHARRPAAGRLADGVGSAAFVAARGLAPGRRHVGAANSRAGRRPSCCPASSGTSSSRSTATAARVRCSTSIPSCSTSCPQAGRPDDIDTPEDYAKIVRLFPRKKPTRKTST